MNPQNKNIVCFVGTRAELIKLAPVLRELKARGVEVPLIATGQNDLNEQSLLELAGNPKIVLELSHGQIVQTAVRLLLWFAKTTVIGFFEMRRFINSLGDDVVLIVHGDTISTVMGAVLGKLCGCKVAHLEAGLRSFHYFNPFPEEIDRVLTSRLADLHLCPNEWAVSNVKGRKGVKISTGHNTLLDSLRLAELADAKSPLIEQLRVEAGEAGYGVFVIHRQENILSTEKLRIFLQHLRKASEVRRCLVVLHAPTEEALKRAGMLAELESIPEIILTKRLPYVEFMQVLLAAEYLVSDGGSNQEEAYYMGLPCFILRAETERNEGLGENVILAGDNWQALTAFLSDFGAYKRARIISEKSASKIAAEALIAA